MAGYAFVNVCTLVNYMYIGNSLSNLTSHSIIIKQSKLLLHYLQQYINFDVGWASIQ